MRHNVDKNFKVVTQDVFTNHNILHSCAVSLPDNTVFLIGGGILSHRRVHKETYQIIKSTKVPRADMTVARAGFACSVFPDFTQIFVAGGSVNEYEATNRCERYLVHEDKWKNLPNLNEAKFNSSLCFVNDGQTLYCFGGLTKSLVTKNQYFATNLIERLSKG